MPNKNYQKGRAFEYKIKKKYEDKGYLVFRSAGSHSVADLIAIAPRRFGILEWKPILIQCKATVGQTYPKECSILIEIAEKFGCRAILETKNKTIVLVK
jgi:Holliday junction resolvase